MPPKGEVAPQGPWTADAETAAFQSLLAQVGGKTPAAGSDTADLAQVGDGITRRQDPAPRSAASRTARRPSRT